MLSGFLDFSFSSLGESFHLDQSGLDRRRFFSKEMRGKKVGEVVGETKDAKKMSSGGIAWEGKIRSRGRSLLTKETKIYSRLMTRYSLLSNKMRSNDTTDAYCFI